MPENRYFISINSTVQSTSESNPIFIKTPDGIKYKTDLNTIISLLEKENENTLMEDEVKTALFKDLVSGGRKI